MAAARALFRGVVSLAPRRGSFEDIPAAILPQCGDRRPRIITFVVTESVCAKALRFPHSSKAVPEVSRAAVYKTSLERPDH